MVCALVDLTNEKAELQKESLKLKHEMENSRFIINDFKDKPQDISFFTGFSDFQTLMLWYYIIQEPTKKLSYGPQERQV